MSHPAPEDPQSTGYALRTHKPGDLGWIIHRHAVLYEAEQGWGTKMELLVSKVGHEFLDNSDPSWDRCWIAERNDEFLGCIVLVRDRDAGETARLRPLLVEPSARGLGLGRALIELCTRFAREVGYVRIRPWTQNVLVGARRLYAKEGYRLVSTEHGVFGERHVGECWELGLGLDGMADIMKYLYEVEWRAVNHIVNRSEGYVPILSIPTKERQWTRDSGPLQIDNCVDRDRALAMFRWAFQLAVEIAQLLEVLSQR